MELDNDLRSPLIHAVLAERVEAVITILFHYRKFDKKLLRQLILHKDKYQFSAGYYASLARNQKICMILNYFEPLISFQRGSALLNSMYSVSMMDASGTQSDITMGTTTFPGSMGQSMSI